MATEVISQQTPTKFAKKLAKGFKRGSNCPNNMKAKTADALNLVDTHNYFSDDRGKVVVVLSDGVSFDLKTNMAATLTKTKTAIENLKIKDVQFATFEFYEYIKGSDDDRYGDLEYNLYKPLVRMDFDSDYRQRFVDVLFSIDSFICPPEDEPITEPPIVCRVPTLDLVYIVDRSKSIAAADIDKVKAFLVELSKKILNDSPDSWIGAISYNIQMIPEIYLQGNGLKRDAATILKELQSISNSTGIGTYTHKALQYVKSNKWFLSNGDNRKDATNLIILITDGVTNIKPYLSKNPKAQGKFSHMTVRAAGSLKSVADIITIGLPNMPAQRLLQGDKKKQILGQAKIDAGLKEWNDMIVARYPDEPNKLKTNLFTLDTMDGMMQRFDDILATVCSSGNTV
ncbi:unnamed protein product [Owenia fusiformis]|nr:unnamed protein product [Owenia fusiformis]